MATLPRSFSPRISPAGSGHSTPRSQTANASAWTFLSVDTPSTRPALGRAHTSDDTRAWPGSQSLTNRSGGTFGGRHRQTAAGQGSVVNEDSWSFLQGEGSAARRQARRRYSVSTIGKGNESLDAENTTFDGSVATAAVHPAPESTSEDDESDLATPPSRFALSPLQKHLVKCVLAYFLASLFTFMPLLSDFLGSPLDVDGPVRNAHVVATVAVYFNPAKNYGQMMEANVFMALGLLYALFLCIGSMATTVYADRLGYVEVAHGLVLGAWLGGGLGFAAYIKGFQKTSMITTCSLVSVITCVVVTKEGAFISEFPTDVIVQIGLIVLVGTLISNVICFAIWPVTATEKLQRDLKTTLRSFATLLDMLNQTFQDSHDFPQTSSTSLKSAIAAHSAIFTSLPLTFGQAAYEGADRYRVVVDGLTRLAQALTGLRASHKNVLIEDEQHVLELFKERVGESMDALTASSKAAFILLGESVAPLDPRLDIESSHLPSDSLAATKGELQRRLSEFESINSVTIKLLYQLDPSGDASSLADPFADPISRVTVGPNEQIFRIYYCCHTLSSFVEGLLVLLDLFISMKRDEEADYWRAKGNRWGFLGRLFGSSDRGHKRSSSMRSVDRISLLFRKSTKSAAASPFPQVDAPHLSNHPSLSRALRRLRDPHIRFAIKTGLGAAILASPAFLASTRSTFLLFKGEWALVSYMIVMSPSQGATNTLAVGRILGTLAGAAVALVLNYTFPSDPVVLPLLGAIFSTIPFYMILAVPKQSSTGRFTLLTYNLTSLYAYNLRDLNVGWIAYHRTVAVVAGVAWAWLISSYVYPYQARRELRRGLSDFLHSTAYFYERLIQVYSRPAPPISTSVIAARSLSTELSPLFDREQLENVVDDFVAMELFLQKLLMQLSGLLVATNGEWSGLFPQDVYRSVLGSAQSILDLLTAMRTLTTTEAWMTHVRRDFVIPVNQERREMVGNVLLLFSILASSVSLKTPMPPYLPPARMARDRLMSRLIQLPVVKDRIVMGGAQSLLYLAYASAMKDVIGHLEDIGRTFQDIFGVIGGASSASEFDSYFQ